MATATHLSPEALLEMEPEDGTFHELNQGDLVTVGRAGARHELVKNRILAALFAWEVHNPGARVFAECLFKLGDDTARIADVAVLLPERVALVPANN